MSTPKPIMLVVEDEEIVRGFIRNALEAENQMFEAETAERGLIEASTRKPDLIILDLGLPDHAGVDFIRDLRSWSSVPVLVLSARSQEGDKIAALDAGADDYLVKPFGSGELLSRVRAILRRVSKMHNEKPTIIEFGIIRLDLTLGTVERSGEVIHLTRFEYRLLCYLVANAGKALTHQRLLHDVWGQVDAHNSPSLRVFMTHLRQKIEADRSQPRHLLTEVGVGYRFIL